MRTFRRTSVGRCALIAFVLAASQLPCSAAVPPMSQEKLRAEADTIVIGKVTKVRTRVTSEDDFVDEDFYIDVAVTRVEKGKARPGQNLTGKTWRPKQRPEGFVGPQGQSRIPKAGDVVHLFCRGTDTFQFRRGGKGRETAHVILEPNGLSISHPLPEWIVGEWVCHLRRDNTTTTTSTLKFYPDGQYDQTGRVDREVNGERSGSSSIARGEAKMKGEKVDLGDGRLLMILRDGRALVEDEYGAMVFSPKKGQDQQKKPNAGNPQSNRPAPSSKALEFARFAGMTIEQLPNGDLKVIDVDPGGSAAKEDIRKGSVIYEWTYENQGGRASWSAKLR